MKRILLVSMIIALALAGCSKDDYDRGVQSGSDEPVDLAERVDGRVVVAYVTYYGKATPDPDYFTNINYGFAELYMKNGVYEGFKLQGDESRFREIVNLKRSHPELKISLSFTHTVSNSDNSQGGGFSDLAKSDAYRKAFAEDCRTFCASWGIDGIDIDWEFPGLSWSGHKCDPEVDVENFTLLMKQLRETLGTRYLLTYAGYVKDVQDIEGGGRKYIDVAAVDPYVDYVNIMTYDIASAPQHQSALRDPDCYWDCERAVNAYIEAGVSTSKLVLGIPFYGRHSFDVSPTAIDYKDIIQLDKKDYKIDNWDEEASVPYVTYKGNYYCGYDNPKSIAIKAQWALDLGMKGLMYWDYDGDDNAGTLRTAVWQETMKADE